MKTVQLGHSCSMRTEGRKDRTDMTKLMAALCNLPKAP